jgi:nucleoside-diphosphate-sugar epimerase
VSRVAFVTGAPGWLGTRVVEALLRGLPEARSLAVFRPYDEVRCLVLRGQDASALRAVDGATVIDGDVADAASTEAFLAGASGATVFHAAGVIHPTGGVKQLFRVNVEGTRNVLAAATKAGARRFVHVSSNSPIGVNPSPEHVFDEDAPYAPYMGYGRSKKLAEDLVNEGGASGAIETAIIRPPWFYGPNQPERQTLFFRMIRDGKFPVLGSGEQRRSMAYVDNICQGLLLCDHVDAAKGRTYWIADERPYPMREIVDTVEKVLAEDFGMKVTGKRMKLPALLGDVAELIDGGLQGVGLYHQKFHVLSEMNKTIACSVERAKRELGYAPTVALREGMRRSVAWVIEKYGGI